MSYALGFLMTLFDMSLFRWTTYGLETGIYLTLFCICVLYSLRFSGLPKLRIRQALVFGVLAGLAGLARLDFGVVLFVFFALALWKKQLLLPEVLIAGSTATLFVAPWLVYTYIITGNFMPSSGGAEAALIKASTALDRGLEMTKAVIGNLTPWNYNPPNLPLAVLGLAPLLIFFFIIKPHHVYGRVRSVLRENALLSNWIVSTAVLIVVYFAFFWDMHFYRRYTLPVMITAVPLLAVLSQGMKNLPRLARTAALYAMPVCFTVWAFVCFHLGYISNPQSVTAGYIYRNFKGMRVGTFQSGVAGYFSTNVFNLDGKVDHIALAYKKENRLNAYVEQRGIQVLVDWPSQIYPNLDNQWLKDNWKPCNEGNPTENTICLVRDDPGVTPTEVKGAQDVP